MNQNHLLELESFGQSVWMDFISRAMHTSGELRRLVEEDGLRGVTSNPSIFEKAIDTTHAYDDAIRLLVLRGLSADEIFRKLSIEDIQHAADVLRPVFERLKGNDGFVSLEVSPHLAHDTQMTIAEARRLWSDVSRPNVMIKVPATPEGLPAIQQLISEGINVNITLLFGLPRYRKVAEAYIAGLEERAGLGKPLEGVASVASFFLSRIDVLLDPMLEKEMREDSPDVERAASIRGQTAIASAKLAYQDYKAIFRGARFRKLASRGAHTQRLLWASTSTKNPAYRDTKYVEPLIGPDTIVTLPIETMKAYKDHGDPAPRLTRRIKEARQVFENLRTLGFDNDAVTQQLEDEGVQKFILAHDTMINTLRLRHDALREQVDVTESTNAGR